MQWGGKNCSRLGYMVHPCGKVIKHPPENESFAGRAYFHPMPCRGRGSGSAPMQLHGANSSCIIMQVLGSKQGLKCFPVFLPRYMNIYVDWQKLIVFIYLFFNSFWGTLSKDILKQSWMEDRLWYGVGCYTTLGECLRIYRKAKKKSWYRRNGKGWGTEEEKLLRFRGLGSVSYQWLMWRDGCVCHRLSCIVVKANEHTWVLEPNFQQESTTVKGYEGVETCTMPSLSMCLCILLCLSDVHRLWGFLHVKSLL